MRNILRFWGKVSQLEDAHFIAHPLLAHMLDTAAVVSILYPQGGGGLSISQLCFLVSLHDIGKVTASFQYKVPDAAPDFLTESGECAYHAQAGYYILRYLIKKKNEYLGNFFSHKCWKRNSKRTHLLAAIAGHHGRPIVEEDHSSYDINPETFEYSADFISILWNFFKPSPLADMNERERIIAEWFLAFVTNQADWIASCRDWFPYTQLEDISDYFYKKSIPQAKYAIDCAGLSNLEIADIDSFKDFFDFINTPTPLQKKIEEIIETSTDLDRPSLFIIEDMMGSGKTEAALYLAQKLMKKQHAKGMFFALPTMATANAIYERLKAIYQKIYKSSSLKPSLGLAHGKAKLRKEFSDPLFYKEEENNNFDEKRSERTCTEWLSHETRRTLMAQIGVGTIDQILMSILPVKFITIRKAGLYKKIVIIDECHAFDIYMNEQIKTFLEFHAAMGGSVILLSATLTEKTRNDFVSSFRKGLDKNETDIIFQKNPVEIAYPLITKVTEQGVKAYPCQEREGLERSIKINMFDKKQMIYNLIEKGRKKGAAIAWIRNTVDDVIESAKKIAKTDDNILVFHARFALCDRMQREEEVIAHFGKESIGKERCFTLIASQVIEQSLDLDFDILCSDLAPMDLILQRAGRLRRHVRQNRPIDCSELFILSPYPEENPSENWLKSLIPGTEYVYQNFPLLWRTSKILFDQEKIYLPKDMRFLIEDAANEENTPETLINKKYEKEGQNMGERSSSLKIVVPFERGYKGESGWDNDIVAATRLQLIKTVIVRLAYIEDGRIRPWAYQYEKKNSSLHNNNVVYNSRKLWSLSELSVSSAKITSCSVPEGLKKAYQAARDEWSQWERQDKENYLLLILMKEDNFWRCDNALLDGQKINIIYDLKYGLQFVKGKENG